MTANARDMQAARRRLDQSIEKRFISPDERRSRVLTAAKYRLGCRNLNQLAMKMGIPWTNLNKALSRRDASVRTIMRLAVALDVSMEFLTEADCDAPSREVTA